MLFAKTRNARTQLKSMLAWNFELSEAVYARLAERYPACARDLVPELYTFFYAVCDYCAHRNKLRHKRRQFIYRSYGRRLMNAKELKGELTPTSDMDMYMDYRVDIYVNLMIENEGSMEKTIAALADYQAELFMALIFDRKISIYDPFDRVYPERQMAERDARERAAITALLAERYAEILPGYLERMKGFITDELFTNEGYVFQR